MLSFNQIKQLLNNIADAHQMINSFGFGELHEINANTTVLYPQMWVVPQQTTILENVIQRQYTLMVHDLVDTGEVIENEILSDTEKILNDVIKILKNESTEYNLIGDVSLTPFTENFGDDLTGWLCTVTIESPYNNAYCDVPAFPFVSPYTPDSGGIFTTEYLQCSDLIYCPTIIDIYNQLDNVGSGQVGVYEVAYGNGTTGGLTSSTAFVSNGTNVTIGSSLNTNAKLSVYSNNETPLSIINTGFNNSFEIKDGSNVSQIYIDYTNQLAFNAGIYGPIYFGTFYNPSAGLAGFSKPGEVFMAVSAQHSRMGVGGGGAYYAANNPQALLEVKGKANEVQLKVIASNGQTKNIVEVVDSTGLIMSIDDIAQTKLHRVYNDSTNNGSIKFVGIDSTGKLFGTTASTGGGSQTLEQVLTNGNSTGNLTIVSPDGKSTLYVNDASVESNYTDGSIINSVGINSVGVNISAEDGINTSYISVTASSIDFTSLSVTKNGVEIATINDIITYTASNGLTQSGGIIKLGGDLTEETSIIGNNNNFYISNINEFSIDALASVFLSAAGGDTNFYFYNLPQTLVNNGTDNRLVISDNVGNKGLVYQSDYSANFTPESLVSKRYVDATVASASNVFTNGLTASAGVVKLGGTLTENTSIDGFYNLLIGDNTALNRITLNAGDFNTVSSSAYLADNAVSLNTTDAVNNTGSYFILNQLDNTVELTVYNGNNYTFLTLRGTPQPLLNNGSSNAMIVEDKVSNKGLVYKSDYSANFTPESLVSKRYTDQIHTSGLLTGGIVTINTLNNAQIDITAGTAIIVDYWTDPNNIVKYNVSWGNITGQSLTYLATSTLTYIGIDKNGTLQQYNTEPTNTQRRDIILLAQIGHTNNVSIGAINSFVSANGSPIEQIRDVISELHLINSGNKVTPNGANMQINKSNGYLFGLGVNYVNNTKDPHKINTPAVSAASFRYRTQLGGSTGLVNTITPALYDNGGVITSIAGSNNQATNQRVYLFPNGNIVIQYGQTVYSTLANAIAAIQTESFIEYTNPQQSALLIAIISVTKGCTALNDSNNAKIIYTTKFGENIGGVAGISVSTLQNVYNNSATPEILTDSSRGALTIKRGSLSDTDYLYEGQNGSSVITSYIAADGSSSFVTQSIALGITHSAPSSEIVYNALLQKADKQNELLTGGIITIGDFDAGGTANDVKISASSWYFNPNTYQTTTDTYFYNIALSSTGLQRYVAFYGNTSNTIIKVEGTESEYAALPSTPANTVLIGYILVTDSAANSAPDLSAYLQIAPRTLSVASSATPTLNTNDYDVLNITALATNITSMTSGLSGSPANFQRLIIRIKDNGTSRTITWGTAFVNMGATLPLATTISKTITLGFLYNSATAKWGCVAAVQEP